MLRVRQSVQTQMFRTHDAPSDTWKGFPAKNRDPRIRPGLPVRLWELIVGKFEVSSGLGVRRSEPGELPKAIPDEQFPCSQRPNSQFILPAENGRDE